MTKTLSFKNHETVSSTKDICEKGIMRVATTTIVPDQQIEGIPSLAELRFYEQAANILKRDEF